MKDEAEPLDRVPSRRLGTRETRERGKAPTTNSDRVLHIVASVTPVASEIDTNPETVKQAIMGMCDTFVPWQFS